MFFRNKNKIKKRTIKSASNSAVVSVKKNKTDRGGRRIFSKILIAFFVLAFTGVTAYVIFLSPFLLVTKISISGNQELSANAVGSAVSSEISGKYLNTLAKNNIALISKEKITNALKKDFKRVEEVEITKIFPDALKIKIKERESTAIFCSREQCFVVDSAGLPYARADFAANELDESKLLILNDDGNKEIKLGENFIDGEYVKYLLAVRAELKSELGLEIDKNFHTPRLISGDIRVKTSEGWMIYFDKGVPIQKEISTLKLVLEKIDKEANEKSQRSKLEYIDLRTGNKVFYKFKNSEPAQIAEEQKKEN